MVQSTFDYPCTITIYATTFIYNKDRGVVITNYTEKILWNPRIFMKVRACKVNQTTKIKNTFH